MAWETRLALEFGIPPQQLRQHATTRDLHRLRAAELKYGLPSDRICHTLAIGFSALCRMWASRGSTIKASDFLPQYDRQVELPYDEWAAQFAAYAKGRNKRHERT